MYKKTILGSKFFISVFVIITALFAGNNVFGQVKKYQFNSPGSPCFFEYDYFAPNNEYGSIKRPFIFVLGEAGENSDTAFERDTLKSALQFIHYIIVYVPNRGKTPADKLQCMYALSSLLTYNYKYGHSNLFLQVNDSAIKQTDIQILGLDRIFKSVKLYEPPVNSGNTLIAATKTADAFKETAMEYDPQEETYGTYYVDESLSDSPDLADMQKPKKTYFGPPKTFNFKLNGIIKDKLTGEALPFANIQIKGTQLGTTSNMDGYYSLAKVPSDTSVLIVQYVGYDKTEVFLTPFVPKTNFLIELRSSAQLLKTVSIISSRNDVSLGTKSEIISVKMTPKKLANLPSFGEKDFMRSFQLMPGISASNESSSGLYVRGGTPDQNLVLYDGFTVYHVDHLYGFFSAFNSNALKDIQLYKGGFESRFGGRLSSVTEITGKEGNQKKYNIGGDLSLLSVNLFAEIPVGEKFTSVIAFRRSYKGALYNKIFDKLSKSETTVTELQSGPGGRFQQDAVATSYFYDLNGKFTYKPNDRDILSLSFFNGTDKLDNSTESQSSSFGPSGGPFGMNSTDLTRYGNIGSSFKWSRKWNDKLYGNTTLSYSNYYSYRDRSRERTIVDSEGESVTTNDGMFENNKLKDYSLKSDYQYNLFSFAQLQFGLFATEYDIKYSYAENDTSSVLDRHDQALLAGMYAQSKMKFFHEKLIFTPGLRSSIYQLTKQIYLEPRASLTYSLTERLSFIGSTGKFYQFANRVTREDILSGSKDFWIMSDGVSVPVSSAIHYIAGFSYETNQFLVNVEAYYKDIQNLTEYSMRFNPSPSGVSYDENFYVGKGYSRGIEFMFQQKVGALNGWLSYTLGEAKNKFSVYSDDFYSANQDVTHEFKAVGMYKYKRWDFSATWIYATGRPYTAPSGAYTVTLLDGTEKDYFMVTSKNALRLPDYHRFDLSAQFKLLEGDRTVKKRKELGYIGFSIFNVYNRKNVWYKQYSIEDGQIIETNVRYLGFTPNLTLSLKLR
jgi:ferric enterobactin receptor